MNKVINYINHLYSIGFMLLSTIFGEHWFLFVLYLLLNVIDELTGWAKARLNNMENSRIGLIGIVKKMCYWILIFIAFLIPIGFEELGKIINIDLSVTIYLGWFVLSSLIINEYRSILENLVEAGCHVPKILINGLEVVAKIIEEAGDNDE